MKKYLIVLIVVWLIYAALNVFAPDPATVTRYGLSLTQTQLLRFTVLLPMLFIWITALFSVVSFKRYTAYIAGSAEEEGFKQITKGLWMLLFVIAIPTIVNAISSYFPEVKFIQEGSVVLRNYITITLYLVGFWYLWNGSKALVKTIDVADSFKRFRPLVTAATLILAAVYTWFIFQNPYRGESSDPLVRSTYYLPDFLIILTIIIPYVTIWFLGMLSILNIWAYAKQVPGLIYQKTFGYVARGLSLTVLLLIALQFLSQANAALSNATLKYVLIIIYLLLLAIAAGYLFIARGARKLTAIEEIE